MKLGGNGSGTVTGNGIDCPGDCTETYANGADVSLTASAAGESRFGGWDGDCNGSDACQVTMSADREVGATFTADLPPPQPGPSVAPAPGPQDSPPPAPASVAPELSKQTASSIGEATSFLYEGSEAIQTEVEPGAIETERTAAVLRGIVTDASDAPLPGVRVTVLEHPELGKTATREDGRYDIAVNGGGPLTLQFERGGFISSQRLVEAVPWLDYVKVDPVALIEYDSASSVIDLDSGAINQVAESSLSQDGDGSRTSTLIFEKGTDATITMPDGSTEPVDEPVVRSTEFTVGPNGLDAMPGQLPPSTAFTYAIELSIDQAVEAGATDVTFSKPVVNYVDNFLEFPTGTAVPTGYYDRKKGEWAGGPDGTVIEIVGEAGGKAEVDVDGDGQADSGVALTELGIDEGELQRLASLYNPNESLWRVQVTHFSPWDHNFPYGPPGDAGAPQNPLPNGEPPGDEKCGPRGSIIDCEGQVLGEQLPVTGTDLSLNYRSNRVPGRIDSYSLDIPVSGATVPSSLEAIELRVEVAGRTFDDELSPTPNQIHHFVWDGEDAYGRTVQGAVPATVRIGYRYEAVYQEPGDFEKSWSRFSGVPVTGDRSREEISFNQEYTTTVGTWDARGLGLGGWTISAQNFYDPGGETLYMGNGERRSTEAYPTRVFNRYAGVLSEGGLGDGGPALDAMLNQPQGIAAGPDGSLYVADTQNGRLRRIDPEGTITTVAGNGTHGFAGDGGAAIDAELAAPEGVAVGGDGALYIADTENNRIRRVTSDGKIETIAGGGQPADELGDDGPATGARLAEPSGVAVAPDGTVYIADQLHNRVRMVSPDGSITTVAGDGTAGSDGDGGPAFEARLRQPHDVAVADDSTVYIADTGSGLVRRIRLDGIIERVAGGGEPADELGDDGDALDAQLLEPSALAFEPNGSVLIADRSADRVRALAPDGTIGTIAGGGDQREDGASAANVELHAPAGLAVLPSGRVFAAEEGYPWHIGAISPIFEGFRPGDVLIPSLDGSQIYQFTHNGRQTHTLDTFTGAVVYSFGYGGDGLLTSITDRGGRTTTIERDAEGNPTAIVAPGGQRTVLSLNADGYLSRVQNPAGEGHDLTYHDAGGLLATMRDPEGGESTFGYEAEGRLVSDEDAEGGIRSLSRQELPSGQRVVLSSNLGSHVAYEMERLPGGRFRRTTINRAGAVTVGTLGADGGIVVDLPDGSRSELEVGPTPVFGLQVPIDRRLVETTPSGLERTTTHTREATFSDPTNPLSLETLTDVVSLNGKPTTTTYDAATRTTVQETPEGRKNTTVLDPQGRIVSLQKAAGLAPSTTTYDAEGRVAEIAEGAQSWTFDYDSRDRVATRTNAGGETVTYEYDDADRLVKVTLPSGRSFEYGYNANGDRISLTEPSSAVNSFDFSATRLPRSFLLPGGANEYVRSYDLEQKLTGLELPSGQQVLQDYDAGQRLSQIAFPQGTVDFAYVGSTERTSSVERAPAGGGTSQTMGLTYDGSLVDGTEFTGDANGAFSYEYDDDLFVSSLELSSGSDEFSIAISRDDDGLPTGYGPFTVGRGGPAGMATSYTVGPLKTELTYDSLGRVDDRKQVSDGQQVYDETTTFADNGKIEARTESSGGSTDEIEYEYDLDGQLTSVTREGVEIESYGYDAAGNRTSREVEGGLAETAIYDSQDRVTSVNGVSYTVNEDGFLVARGSDEFSYSARGELLSAAVGGATVTYGYDGLGRRVSREQEGEKVGYLYGNPGDPYQVTAVREPGGDLDRLYYDEKGLWIALERGGQRYNVATDQVGTPRVVSDETGAVVKALDFDAFGVPLTDSNPAFHLPLGFAGGLSDETTELVRFGLRDYEPLSGRFTARDPTFFEGSPYNLYVYVGSDPVGLRDPSGLFCISYSSFAGLGHGESFCLGASGISVCSKFGVGIGGGVSFDLFGTVEETGIKLYGEFSASYGKGSVSGSLSHKLGPCPNLDWKLSASSVADPLKVGAGHDSEGIIPNLSVSGGGPGPKKFGKVGVEASAGVEFCLGGKPW